MRQIPFLEHEKGLVRAGELIDNEPPRLLFDRTGFWWDWCNRTAQTTRGNRSWRKESTAEPTSALHSSQKADEDPEISLGERFHVLLLH